MKEIFWGDYNIDEKKAIDMIKNGSDYEKRFMFGKILFNSLNLLRDISYFKKEDLKELLEHYEVKSEYKKNYVLKRLNILKKLYLGKDCKIKELQWKKRTI